ncbi:MAG: DUF1343 domain-containing protein [Balneolaceae bacterium]
MKSNQVFLLIPFLVLILTCNTQQNESISIVKTGAEVLIENYLPDLAGKRVGLVVNHTARVGNTLVLDTLISSGVHVTSIFAPEHGYRGESGAGEIIEDGIDVQTGVHVFSLYGSNKRPTQEMMESIDILIFDMQDVGARFYTYNTTMKYILEAGNEFNKEVWILDRPNPAGGEYVAGWILEKEFESFVGAYPIPIAHGLTLGELAIMAVNEGWLKGGTKPDFRVIKMEGWNRSMKWPDTGLEWVPPSPNLPSFEHAFVYLGTCFFEGTTLSEGRGTSDPFLTIGSPSTNIEPIRLESISKNYKVELDTVTFIPKSIQGKSLNPKFEGKSAFGVSIKTTPEYDDPVSFGVELMHYLMDQSEGAEYKEYLHLLAGTKKIINPNSLQNWGESFEEFTKKRKKYFLYD